MARLIKFVHTGSMEEVEIIRDKEALESIEKVSELINGLSLPSGVHNDLVNAMVEMCQLMERNAYKQGFDLGLKLNDLN